MGGQSGQFCKALGTCKKALVGWVLCTPNKAPLMAKLVSGGENFDRGSEGPERFEGEEVKSSGKKISPIGYSGGYLYLLDQGGRTAVFNRCSVFDRAVSTALRRATLSSVSRILISGVDDLEYDA
ncbi:hypothetical protein BHE74_00042827 [Ensete ventricosum]|nr:hypothetical protein GW17_00007027 [Ensete ventricosum]RWW50877.1 hypothetical protein BHE74_00042827 [Ensete ventricosum]